MDFKFSEEKRLLRRIVTQFVDVEIAPLVKQLEERERFFSELLRRRG